MAESLESFKRRIKVNTRINVKNYGKGRDYDGTIYRVGKSYFDVARRVSKEYYDEWRSILRKGTFVVYHEYGGAKPEYFSISRISWQLAKHTLVDGDVAHFFSYPEKLSSGQVVPAPFNNIPIGREWMTISIDKLVFASRYW